MKTSDIIEEISHRIWNPEDPETEGLIHYPCFRIDETVTELKAPRTEYRVIKRIFLDTLDGFKTFEGWGIENKLFSNQETPENRKIIQIKRIEWMNKIIEELRNKRM